MADVIVGKTEKLSGSVDVPPSKSYTHRAVITASLSEGASKIMNPLFSEDTLATIDACKSLGVVINGEEDVLIVNGTTNLKAPAKAINCRLSASTIRFMTAVASLAEGVTVLTGEQGLLKRPIGPLTKALKQLNVKCKSSHGYPPVKVYGRSLLGGEASIVGDVSSQFITGLLLACPLAKNDTHIKLLTPLESKPYVQLTLDILKRHGIAVEVLGDYQEYFIPSGQEYKSHNHKVVGDFSSAAFLMAAAAITKSHINLKNLNTSITLPDIEILEILQKMGAKVVGGEGILEVSGGELEGIDVDARNIPDLVPVCVVLACYAKGKTKIRNVKRLRIKESDRLESITTELSKMDAKIKCFQDELVVEGPCKMKGAVIDPHGDHRIAMACVVAALGAEGETKVTDIECINKSYPNFLQHLEKLGGKIQYI